MVAQSLADGSTALSAACKGGTLEAVALLCEHGADAHALADGGVSTVLAATAGGHLAVVRYLVEVQGVASGLPNAAGVTALCLAAEKGYGDTARYLLNCSMRAAATTQPRRSLRGDASLLGMSRLSTVQSAVADPNTSSDTALNATSVTMMNSTLFNSSTSLLSSSVTSIHRLRARRPVLLTRQRKTDL